MWRCHTQVETPFARKRSFDTLCSAMNLFSLTSQKAAWRIWFIHLRKRVAIKMFFFLSFSKEEKHHSMIYDWRLVAPASSPFDNYPKKKNQKTGAKRENGLQGDGMCFWKRICADGWVSETEQKESASTPDNWLWRTWIPFLSFLSGAFQKKNNQNSIECRYFRASLRGILGTTYTTTAQVYKRRRCQSALLKNKKKNRYTIDGDCGR